MNSYETVWGCQRGSTAVMGVDGEQAICAVLAWMADALACCLHCPHLPSALRLLPLGGEAAKSFVQSMA
eukprot:1444157-Pleurochrysis_carterae.AAC.1